MRAKQTANFLSKKQQQIKPVSIWDKIYTQRNVKQGISIETFTRKIN